MITLTEQIGQPISYSDDNMSFFIDPESIMVDIEGLHAVTTGNYTRYIPIALENSIYSWTHPFHKPVIMHHNEKDGKIIGRIISVEYKSDGTRSGTPALVFTVNIPDDEGKRQIKDGRLLTVSVGISATDCRCSICGKNIAEYGPCEHERGHEYGGEICYWDIYAFTGKELSYVITPSDPYTHNLKIYSPTSDHLKNIKEQLDMQLQEVLDTTITEGQNTQEVNNEQEPSNNVNDQNETPVVDEQPATEQPLTESEGSSEEDASTGAPTEDTPAQEEQHTEDVPLVESTDSDLLDRVVTLTEQLAVRTEELRTERNLRESLENSLAEVRSQYKIMLAATVNTLRGQLGKSLIESEELTKRSEASLRDTISDYTNELALQESEEQHDNVAQEETPAQTVSLTEGLKEVESPANVPETADEPKKQQPKIDVAKEFYNLDKILFSR